MVGVVSREREDLLDLLELLEVDIFRLSEQVLEDACVRVCVCVLYGMCLDMIECD